MVIYGGQRVYCSIHEVLGCSVTPGNCKTCYICGGVDFCVDNSLETNATSIITLAAYY